MPRRKLIRYPLIGSGVLAAVVLSTAAIGSALPERHTASRSTIVAASPDTVFGLVSRVEEYPRWRTGVERVQLLSAPGTQPLRFVEQGRDGRIAYEATVSAPARRMVSRIADPSLPFGGEWVFQVTPAHGGSELRITENGEVYNPIFRFVSRFVVGHTRGLEQYLTDAARALGS